MDTKELTVVEESRSVALEAPSIFTLPPEGVVMRATAVANVLKDVITKQNLAVNIGGKKYVPVEAWNLMGVLLGILPREEYIKEYEDGSYEAKVVLVKTDGTVVGGASSVVGMDEPTWRTRPKFARRSMACTRATGKAYRLSFSWVMSLAGYAPTPLEEMPETGRQAATVDPMYTATPTQKAEFKILCTQNGVTDIEDIKRLSEEYKGKYSMNAVKERLATL